MNRFDIDIVALDKLKHCLCLFPDLKNLREYCLNKLNWEYGNVSDHML